MKRFSRIPKFASMTVLLGACSLLAACCNFLPITQLVDKVLIPKSSRAVVFAEKYVFVAKPIGSNRHQGNPDVSVNFVDMIAQCEKNTKNCCYAKFKDGELQKPGWMGNPDCLTNAQKKKIEDAAEACDGNDYAGFFGKGGDTCMKSVMLNPAGSPVFQNQIAMLLQRYSY